MEADGTFSNGRGAPVLRKGGRYGVSPPCKRSSCAPSSIQTVGRSVSSAAWAAVQNVTARASDDTVESNCQRVSRAQVCAVDSSLIGSFPPRCGYVLPSCSPILCDAHAEEA